ncbi:hypothetical protein GIB67_003513 [Kingdonia uniflora]|uniref:Pentatricopeptide repeat-containing protein n=1 Tax=Kingdonia uniflora TaxID=39325 RepID=A0A7J7MEI9_9MAGN|nr:hypothetical protein GIB67_003513 [Kingdonia uniflora]
MLRSTTLHKLKSPLLLITFNTIPTWETPRNLIAEETKYSLLLQQCDQTHSLEHGRAIHAKFIKESLVSSMFLHNHLLNMYVKCGDSDECLQLFGEMFKRNVVSWSAVILGCPNESMFLFRSMVREGVRPNGFTFVGVLKACSEDGQAYQVYAWVVRMGFEENVFLTNAFVTALMRGGKLTEAVEVFERCPVRDIVSWNAIITGYLQFSYADIPIFWCKMNREGVKPDNFTFSSVLTGLGALGDIKMSLQVHAQLVKYGHGDEICVGNSLVDIYLKNMDLIAGMKAFDEMPSKDVVSWTQMASGCLQCGEPSKALRIIEEMKMTGVNPNRFTLATAVNACANLASLEEGKKVHSLRIKLGNEVDVCVENALLDMYAKCGCMEGAMGVFRLMRERSVISWTTMIMGFAQNGETREALKIFDRMKLEHAEPNYITFVCVLYACSQGGLEFLNKAWDYFSSMTCDYGIAPGRDHYICMIDLLARAGKLKEAEALIQSMPFQPGVLVWQTLLGACRVYGDLEMGKRAAECALALNKEDPSTYLLLSNMFADSRNWDNVVKLRDLMESTDVKKIPGCSWKEVGAMTE